MECLKVIENLLQSGISEFILVLIAGITLRIGYIEYCKKNRPYIFPELIFNEENGNWYFSIVLSNGGNYPARARINSAILKIGDELYTTNPQNEIIVNNQQGKNNIKHFPIGHINQIGRDKIIKGEYSKNRVEIDFSISSKSLGEKKYKFHSRVIYEIDVKGQLPIIQLITEEYS